MPLTAQLNALIVDGQAARVAQSANTLSELLSLPPDERWRVLSERDSQLDQLVTEDYQRLLMLTVEPKHLPHPPGAQLVTFTTAPLQLPATLPPSGSRLSPWAGGLFALLLLTLDVALGGLWMRQDAQEDRWTGLERQLDELTRATESNREAVAAQQHSEENPAIQAVAQQRQSTLLVMIALEHLKTRINDGQSYATEWATLLQAWPDAGKWNALGQPAAKGLTSRATLIQQLQDFISELATRRRTSWGFPWFMTNETRALDNLERRFNQALESIRQNEWTNALFALQHIDQPRIQAWREALGTRLDAEQALGQLEHQAMLALAKSFTPPSR